MRRHLPPATLLATALAALAAAPASAGWTPALSVPRLTAAAWQAQAVNARGDVAVAGVRASNVGRGGIAARASVVLGLRRAGGSFGMRTLASARDAAVAEVAIALDGGGRPTVAWIERRAGRTTVRAAFRTASGRWIVQAVGRSSAFFNTAPRVAAAPDGTVALTYYAAVQGTPGMAAAWRSRSGGFGRVQALRVGTRRGAYLTEPALAFDRRGTAFLAGAAACGQAPSTGVLYTGTARSRRFGAGRVAAPAPAKSVGVAVTGAGSVVMTWLTGSCTPGSEDLSGMPMAAVVRSGRIGAPVALSGAAGYQLTVAGSPGGAAATWAVAGQNGVLMTAAIGGAGQVGAAQAPQDGWVPVAADDAGDQLLRQVRPQAGAAVEPLAARAAGATALQPAPVMVAGFPWEAGTAAAGHGRALAVLTVSGTRPVAAVWRP